MEIKVLGQCCKKSTKNYENVIEAVKQSGKDINVVQVSDMNEIMKLGVMATPGLVIDNKVVSSGIVLTVEQILKLINPCTCGNC
ncbi:MAG: thioredoxin family protein [bacterium]